MTTKNLGPAVSGYLDPEGRAWETTVYQSGKPVLDKELNLIQDTEQDMELRLRRRSMPSGWISDDFLGTSDMTGPIYTLSAVANELRIPQDLRAHVNGWLVRVANTGSNTENKLSLGAGPAGAGAKRTDLVILEVWRRLISASPSTVGKSPAARIWLNGNVKIAGADDLTLNFVDDILDGAVGSETTKRVQIQYRLRVIQGVDIFAYTQGIADPVVVANSVPPNAATPDGSATVFNYVNQSSVGDPGLWVAGDGNPANTLGTVDGYMYAIPLMAVIRRNTTAFARNTNHNGGVSVSPGPSDRPDGLFHDIIAARDIVDLRTGVSPVGWNYQEILERNFGWLMDNAVRTEITQTGIGAGVHGNTVLWADEIGITNAHGGDGTTTGDTPGAEFIGEFDAIRRRFSDRVIVETVVLLFFPSDGSGGGPNWANGDVITINPTALRIGPYSPFNWASYAPSDVAFIDMPRAMFLGNGAGKTKADLSVDFTVTGMGNVPMTSLTLNIGTVPAGVTNENLFVTLLVMYPPGVGMTFTPTDTFGAVVNNPGQLPAAPPVEFGALDAGSLSTGHREIDATYRTLDIIISYSHGPGFNDTIHFIDRVHSITSIVINAVPYLGGYTISPDGYMVTLGTPGSFTTGEATVTFKARRPLPQNDEQLTFYYERRAPQTVRDGVLSNFQLKVIPRFVPSHLYTLTVGSGSQDEAYPYPFQNVQAPGVYPGFSGTFSGDHEFEGSGVITLDNVTVSNGFIQLPVVLGYVSNPQEAIFNRLGGDVDFEGRSYFKDVPPGYSPNAFAPPLKIGSKTRRTIMPMLAELREDTLWGKQGQLVMLVFSQYYETDVQVPWNNSFAFNGDLDTTSVSVYKVKGNLLNRRST